MTWMKRRTPRRRSPKGRFICAPEIRCTVSRNRIGGRSSCSRRGSPGQANRLRHHTMYWMGIDIGTGGTRALLVDSAGKARAAHTAAHEEMRMERPLWAEQRPEDWWRAAVEAIRGVLAVAGAAGGD